jgi:hypothetical protein
MGGRTDGPFEHVPFDAKELDGVIFGVRTAEVERRALTSLLGDRYPHLELLQAKTRNDAFALTIKPLWRF